MLYSIALFLHVLGALGMFIGLGVEWTSLRNLPDATNTREARGWLGLFLGLRRIYPLSFFTILISGVYMMAVSWGGEAWIAIGLLGLLALPAIAGFLTARRIRRIGPELEASGELDASIKARLTDPVLLLSHRLRVGLAVGIIFLMTVKPGWVGSAIAILAFTALGGLAGVAARKRADGKRPQPDHAPSRTGAA
jgi:hypothetical protein